MKKAILAFMLASMLLVVWGCACGSDDGAASQPEPGLSDIAIDEEPGAADEPPEDDAYSSGTLPGGSEESTEPLPSPPEESGDSEPPETTQQELTQEENAADMIIQVSAGDATITFRLNASAAAKGLYDQLPLTLEVENYSDNEKIFYPPEKLDTTNTPLAGGGIGTLAYYAPWGNVVLFYGEYSPNGSLYQLGQAESGQEHIQSLSGTIQISKG